MSNTLYLECLSGISGDMTVAALIDLGADKAVMDKALASLGVCGFTTEISRVKKAGLDVCDFNVKLEHTHENHDHDMEYLHGQAHTEAHPHDDDHIHIKEHKHEHRCLADILEIIQKADMTGRAKKIAADIFTVLGEAEAKAHGSTLYEVHFHEVGAVDSIVDIVSAAVCLDNLDITQVIVPKLCEGRGTVRCQHGTMPVPVPAVTHIAEAYGLQLHITDIEGELVTPTGAAIVGATMTSFKLPIQFTIKKSGMGAGKRTYERPSILRAMIIEAQSEEEGTDHIYKLESNIDDCSGEVLGFVMERLLAEGAKDVHYTPVLMKKNRPAYQLNVICQKADMEKLEQIIFEETTTIGIRRLPVERSVLKREVRTICTTLGEADIKFCECNGKQKVYPEYDSVAALCKAHKRPYQEIYDLIRKEACSEERS